MSIHFGGVIRDAWAMLRRDEPVLLPVVGLLAFVPQLAVLLLIPELPIAPEQQSEAAMLGYAQKLSGWGGSYGLWYLAAVLLGLVASLSVLALYLDSPRPDVSGALGRAVRLLPRYIVAQIVATLPAGAMLALLLSVPGALLLAPAVLYLLGRTFVVGALIVAERPIGPVAAVLRAWRLSRGNGLLLAVLAGGVLCGGPLIGSMLLAAGRMLAGGPAVTALFAAAAAAAAAASALAAALTQIVAYRRLSGASSGT